MTLATCHPSRKLEGREMCKPCYDKWLKINNPIYRSNQISNTTKWKLANPEKNRILVLRRQEKVRNDPLAKRKVKNSHLIRKYGITIDTYENMLIAQNNSCAMCFRKQGKTALHVDHDHKTGRVRGLLCHQCNWFLGIVDHDIEIVHRMIKYVNGEL